MSTLWYWRMMYIMEHSDILKVIMPERTKQIALAWSILRESQLAEDVYQDMLAKVLENSDIFEGPRHLRDWSWKVLRNRCFELLRQRDYHVTLLDESILELVDAELESRDPTDFSSRIDALYTCLESLSEQARETIKMRYFDGMQGKQIAEKLGRKPETVYKSLQRIYATLSRCIQRKLAAFEAGGSTG